MRPEQAPRGLRETVQILRGGALVVLACCGLAGVIGWVLSDIQPKRYTATADILFNGDELSQQVAGLTVVNSADPTAQQDTNVALVQLGDIASKTAAALRQGLTTKTVQGSLSVTAQGDTSVVAVSATAKTPTLAAAVANTYSALFVREQSLTTRRYYTSALALVSRELASLPSSQRAGVSASELAEREQSLSVLADLPSGVQVAERASTPTSPSSPKIARNTVFAALLGLLLGLGLVYVSEHLDSRVRDPEEFEAIYGLPILGSIPESSVLGRDGLRRGLPPADAEAFKLLHARLRYYSVDRKVRSLIIASAEPGDGKTTVAYSLCVAGALLGSRVLLIEADLRRPSLALRLDLHGGPGLSDVLIGASTIDEAVRVLTVGMDAGLADNGRTVHVLPAGAPPPNPGELLESQVMRRLISEAREQYDLVVVDTSPLGVTADAFPLLGNVDGIIVVGRVNGSRRDFADRLRSVLTEAEAPCLGIVANGVKTRRFGASGYEYAYQYVRES